MAADQQVKDFVRRALMAGRPREEIGAALSAAGWTDTEVAAGLGAWADAAGMPPVPRPSAGVSARDAAAHLLLFALLSSVVWPLVALLFGLIDRLWPDPLSGGYVEYYDPGAGLRWQIAMLLPGVPLLLFLAARVRRAERSRREVRTSTVRRAIAAIGVVLAALAFVGDAVAVIYGALAGDLSGPTLAKALVVAVVAGLVALWYREDLRNG